MKCIKLTYRSPMFGLISCPDAAQFKLDRIELSPSQMCSLYDRDSLCKFLKDNEDELSEYFCDDLKDLIVRADFGKFEESEGGMYFLTKIYVRREPTSSEYRYIIDWITGQMSDGWGEGLEQHSFMEEPVSWSEPVFDVKECTWYTEEVNFSAEYYVKPWSSSSKFRVDLWDSEEVYLDIPSEEPTVYAATCKLQDNGVYTVRTVYNMGDLQDAINCIKDGSCFFDDEFVQWIEIHGTFGCAVQYFIICVNEGMFSKFLPTLGVQDMDAHKFRIYTMDAEDGSVQMEEYTEEQKQDFYTAILNK